MLTPMLIIGLLYTSPIFAFDVWSQNSTWFVRLSSTETHALQWTQDYIPPAQIVVNGTYFNECRKPIVLIRRWNELLYDQPIHLPPRPSLFLPLQDKPIITYDRSLIGRWLIGAGPLMVNDGQIDIRLQQERFQNDIITSKRFSAIGVKNDGSLILVVTTNRTLEDIAWCLCSLGCDKALRLDGGSSTYLSINGQTLVGNRRCSNYLFVQ